MKNISKFFVVLSVIVFLSTSVSFAASSTVGDFSFLDTIFKNISSFFSLDSVVSKISSSGNTATVINNIGTGLSRHEALVILLDYKNGFKDPNNLAVQDWRSKNDLTMKEFSYGQLSVGFTVLPWYHLNKDYTSGRMGHPVEDVIEVLNANNVDLGRYNRIITEGSVSPGDSGSYYANASAFTSWPYRGNEYQIPTIRYAFAEGSNPSSVMDTHEYGHTFGLGHAGQIACGVTSRTGLFFNGGAKPQAPYTDCIYDDPTNGEGNAPYGAMSSMGYFGSHYNAYEKDTAGFFRFTSNPSVGADAYYMLNIDVDQAQTVRVSNLKSISSQNKGIKAVKIHSLDKRILPLYIETRDGTGIYEHRDLNNQPMPPEYVTRGAVNKNGLLIGMVHDSIWGPNTFLMDLNPAQDNFSLRPGDVFSDVARGIKILNVQSTASGINFDVEISQPNFDLIKQSGIDGLWRPVIDSVSMVGPSFLKKGETGKWTVSLVETGLPNQVVDSGAQYNYTVDFGDGQLSYLQGSKQINIESRYLSSGYFRPRVTVKWTDRFSFITTEAAANSNTVAVGELSVDSIKRADCPTCGPIYDFKIKMNGFPCNTILDINRGFAGSYGKIQKTIACDPGKTVIQNKVVDDAYVGYPDGVYEYVVTARGVSSSLAISNTPPKPVNAKITRLADSIALTWGNASGWDSTDFYQVYFAGPINNQDAMQDYVGIPASSMWLCTKDKTGRVALGEDGCVVEVKGKGLMNYAISPIKDYYFYIRRISPNNTTASGWVPLSSLKPVDFTPGTSITQVTNPALSNQPIDIIVRAKRDKTVGVQTIKNRLTFSGGLTPTVTLDSATGAYAYEPSTGGGILPNSFIVPVTFADGQAEATRHVFVKFSGNPPSAITPIFEVNVGTFKDFVLESIKTNNKVEYAGAITIAPANFTYAPTITQISASAGLQTASLDWSLVSTDNVESFVILRSGTDMGEQIPKAGSALSCINSSATLCSIGVATGVNGFSKVSSANGYGNYKYTDSLVAVGAEYIYRIYGTKSDGRVTAVSPQYSFTPSVALMASASEIRVSRPSSAGAGPIKVKTIVTMSSANGINYSSPININTAMASFAPAVSGDKFIVSEPVADCKNITLTAVKKCAIYLNIFPALGDGLYTLKIPLTGVGNPTSLEVPVYIQSYSVASQMSITVNNLVPGAKDATVNFSVSSVTEGELAGVYISPGSGFPKEFARVPLTAKSIVWPNYASLPSGNYIIAVCRTFPGMMGGIYDKCSPQKNITK